MLVSGQVQNLEQILKITKEQQSMAYIPSKHKSINKMLGGYGRGTVNTIAAAKAMGKTAFMISELRNFIELKQRVVVFNLEMMHRQFIERLKCNYTGIENYRLRRNEIDTSDARKILDFENWFIQQDQYLTLDFTGGTYVE